MRTYRILPIASLLATTVLAVLPVAAQQSAPPSDAPPKLEKLEDVEPPSVKIGKPDNKPRITETRDDGQTKEIEVQSGKSTYYVKQNQQVGDSVPGDTQSMTNHAPQWKVLEFDLGSKNKGKKNGDDANVPADGAAADAPAPPTTPSPQK